MAGQLLRPIAGDGILARFGHFALLCAAGDPRHDAQITELLDVVCGVAERGGDGRRLSRRIAGLLLSDEDDRIVYPALAVVGPLDDGLAVLVHGAALVEVEAAGHVERLDGAQTVTWVDRRITGPIGGVRALLGGAIGTPDGWSRLDSGIIRAGGFLWGSAVSPPAILADSTAGRALLDPAPWQSEAAHANGTPLETAADVLTIPAAARPEPAPMRPSDATRGGAHTALTPAAGVAARADEIPHVNGSAEPEPSRVRLMLLRTPEPSDLVTGCLCESGHFTAPTDARCRECGADMPQPPASTVARPQPVLGVLAVDGGPRLPVDGVYVVGRDPGSDEDVDAGRAKPLRLTDIDGRIAAVHARIEPHDWEIQVVDLGTPGGTHYCPPDATDWNRVMPNVPTTIALGSKVLFGRTGVRFETMSAD